MPTATPAPDRGGPVACLIGPVAVILIEGESHKNPPNIFCKRGIWDQSLPEQMKWTRNGMGTITMQSQEMEIWYRKGN